MLFLDYFKGNETFLPFMSQFPSCGIEKAEKLSEKLMKWQIFFFMGLNVLQYSKSEVSAESSPLCVGFKSASCGWMLIVNLAIDLWKTQSGLSKCADSDVFMQFYVLGMGRAWEDDTDQWHLFGFFDILTFSTFLIHPSPPRSSLHPAIAVSLAPPVPCQALC